MRARNPLFRSAIYWMLCNRNPRLSSPVVRRYFTDKATIDALTDFSIRNRRA